MKLALTGGTGFVGSHLIDIALAQGHELRALTRRPQPHREGVTWIEGALDAPTSLTALVNGADAVIHVAGVVTGSPEQFQRGNVEGTRAMVAAAEAAGVRRFVHISSLGAREPQLSAYGASKLEAEPLVTASDLDWTILRPPAIYGPRDKDMFELFRFARRGLIPVVPAARLSLIAAEDLARLILACVANPASIGHLYEPDDGRADGWTQADLARAVAAAMGVRARLLPLATPLLRVGATLDRLVRGKKARLTPDRVGYLTHPDWTVTPTARPPASLWRAALPTEQGLAETAAWYREQRWL